jgi:hypothetical protein
LMRRADFRLKNWRQNTRAGEVSQALLLKVG